MMRYPLLRGFEPGHALAYRGGIAISAAEFSQGAHALAQRLPHRRHVLNLCEDRYNFLLGFAAALISKQITLLPPSSAAAVVRQVYTEHAQSYCLFDSCQPPADLEAISLAAAWYGAASDVPHVSGGQIAVITFTSGSTGAPVAHAKTWRALVESGLALGKALGFEKGAAKTIVGTIPAQHMYGIETTVMLPLQWGCAVHAGRPLLPADIHAALAELPAARWLMTTPLHVRACAAERVALPELEGVVSATMPMPLELAHRTEALWRAPLYEIYGCTESGWVATRRTTSGPRWRVCEGLAMRQCADRTFVFGGHLKEAMPLGDSITLHSDTEFTLHGRTSDLVKIAGKRASLQALNAALNGIEGVIDAVFYAPENGDRERLIAFAVAPGLRAPEIIAQLRQSIDAVFLPRPLYMVDELPRTAMGKLTRSTMRELATDCSRRQLEQV